MNPILIAVFGIVSVIMAASASYILMPVEDRIHSQANYTGNAKAQEVADTQHDVFVITPPTIVGALFLSLFLQAVRRQQDEVYE